MKHRNTDQLNRSFATPIDREDIFRAITSLDDVIGYAKTTVREMDILQVTPDEPMQQMAGLLRDGMQALQQGYAKLAARPLDAEPCAQTAHKTERATEKIYRQAAADLLDEQRIGQAVASDGIKLSSRRSRWSFAFCGAVKCTATCPMRRIVLKSRRKYFTTSSSKECKATTNR